jgi:hypothetical protein
MGNLEIILALIGFCRIFYFAIGEPLSNHRSNAILYFYTENLSKLIAWIHGIKTMPFDNFYTVQYLIEKYYKFLGFCYPCFTFWVASIFWAFNSNSIQEYLTLLGVTITFNFILTKWTI